MLHFDGFSAAKTTTGPLHSQNILAWENPEGDNRSGGFGDAERGRLLCEWAEQFGIEGFSREEATYEVRIMKEKDHMVRLLTHQFN